VRNLIFKEKTPEIIEAIAVIMEYETFQREDEPNRIEASIPQRPFWNYSISPSKM
jgi:hypothetical protein